MIDYAHKGRRRKKITEDLFRCKNLLDLVSPQKIECNALVWRNMVAMRDHLIEHCPQDEIDSLTDIEIVEKYEDASRKPQEGIPDNDED